MLFRASALSSKFSVDSSKLTIWITSDLHPDEMVRDFAPKALELNREDVMLPNLPSTQLSCYLGPAPWDRVQALGRELLGHTAQMQDTVDPTLVLHGERGHLRVERYALQPDRYPWTYLLQLTLERPPSPLDLWQQVQFTRGAVQFTNTTGYCDVPEEVGVGNPAYYWQLQLRPIGEDVQIAVAQLDEKDEDWFLLLDLRPVDLRNFEMYQVVWPY